MNTPARDLARKADDPDLGPRLSGVSVAADYLVPSLPCQKIVYGDLEDTVAASTCSIVFFAGDGFQKRAVALEQSDRANRIGVEAL